MSAKLLKSDVITVSVVIASQLLNIAKQHFLSSETTIWNNNMRQFGVAHKV